MKIELDRIKNEPERFDTGIELPPEAVDADVLAGPMQVHLKGEIQPHDGGYLVMARFSCSGSLACSRCLEPIPWSTDEQIMIELRRPEELAGQTEIDLEEEDLDVTFLESDHMDLEELASEQVSLALPMRVVCDESCSGLCPQCGGNRNLESGCSCEPQTDPRWQALRDLKGRGRSA